MDIKLNYVEKGSGPPLLLLHGNGEDTEYFKHQLEYFEKSYRVIAVDTRGHGKSPRGDAPFTLAQFVEDLKHFVGELGIRKMNLLGFSDGGNIALMFTLKYPQYVEKLIVNGANIRPSGVKVYVQAPIVIGYGMTALLSPFSKNARKNKALLRLMVTQPHIRPQELQQIQCPTLVIAGMRDMIRDSHTRLIAKSIPGARLVIIPGDHFIALKKSGEFNDAVGRFLTGRLHENRK